MIRSRPEPGYVFEAWLEDKNPLHTRRDLMERDEVVEHLQAMVAGSINGKDIDTLQAATSLLENRWSGFDDEDLRELRAGAAQRYEGSKAVPEEYRERAGRLAGELRQEFERREAERANYRGPGIYRAAGNGAEYVVAGILGADDRIQPAHGQKAALRVGPGVVMFPLQLTIERVDAPESFEMPNDGSILTPSGAPPRYHVTAVVLDVERRRTISYEFWSMVDPNRDDFENVGRITHAPTSAQIENLRGLRDALNEILED